jgi:hypothetical protein
MSAFHLLATVRVRIAGGWRVAAADIEVILFDWRELAGGWRHVAARASAAQWCCGAQRA